MLKEFLKKRDERSIRKALDESLNRLSQTIRHVLKDMSESLKNTPQYAEDEMLTWATCSTSQLGLVEMKSVAKWRSESGSSEMCEGSMLCSFSSNRRMA